MSDSGTASTNPSIVADGTSTPRASDTKDEARVFPLLKNNGVATVLSSDAVGGRKTTRYDEDNDDEPTIAEPFIRNSSADSRRRGGEGSGGRDDGNVTEGQDVRQYGFRHACKMHKFSLYETASRYYIVGVDVSERRYRILKIDRTNNGTELNMTDDKIVYSLKEMNQLLDTIDDGNRGNGGIKLRCTTWGLLGFIKFTGPYYMLLITKKSTVAMVGGHYIYQIEGTDLVPLTPGRVKPDARNTEEQRFLAILSNLDLTKSFYYSYCYDVTRTLQHNIMRERTDVGQGINPQTNHDFNSMFTWNHYLLQPAVAALSDPFDWCRPIIHGYIDQAGKCKLALTHLVRSSQSRSS